jgi:threonine/homoserine/homoserine lactone efflux protein
MAPDPLDIIAASYAGVHETNQRLAVLLAEMRATQHLGLRLLGLGLRIQTFAIVMIGLTALGVGVLIWGVWTAHQESAALLQALTAATHTLEQRLR